MGSSIGSERFVAEARGASLVNIIEVPGPEPEREA